jgi:type I restriction enzyme S subunit
LPSQWTDCRLDELASVIYGISEAISNNKDPALGPPIVRMANISLEGDLDLSDLRYCPIPKGKEVHFELKPGDLLLNWRSGSASHIGKTAIFQAEGRYTCASFILRIRARPDKANNRYLRHLLNYMRAEGVFTGSSRMQINHKLNAAEFSAFQVRIPPSLEFQEVIADKLDAVEALSRQCRFEILEKKSQAVELREAVLRKAFAGEL